jgi:hypothetical protein
VPRRGALEGGPEAVPEGARRGPPPLRPFGLVLHRDGSWTHEGHPITHARLRAAFDRSVRFLPEQGKYAVQIGRFRGEIEVEEAAFFVRHFDAEGGAVTLSDGTREPLDVASLGVSLRDGALLCRVKRDAAPPGLLARFTHAAHADLLAAVEVGAGRPALRLGGALRPLPEAVAGN